MPQLNFSVPAGLLERIDQGKPEFLSRAAYLTLLISQALDGGGTLGVTSAAGTPSSTPKRTYSTLKKTSIYLDIERLIHEELEFLRAELIEWWALRRQQYGKQAIGSERAWNASQGALLSILRVHGRKVAQDTVTAALANAWRGIRESYAVLPKPTSPSQPPEPNRHPAAREFRNGRFVDEESPTNPVMASLLSGPGASHSNSVVAP